VKDAIDGHRAFDILIEGGRRKAAHQPPTIVFVDKSMPIGRTADRFSTRADAAQKVLSQADFPTLVPRVSLGKVFAWPPAR
jgi:hypothetical protein